MIIGEKLPQDGYKYKYALPARNLMKLRIAALLIVMRGALIVSASDLSHTHKRRELWDKLEAPSYEDGWAIIRKEGEEVYLGLTDTDRGFTPKQEQDIGEKKCKLVVIRQPTNLFPLAKDADLKDAIKRSFEHLKKTTRVTIAYGTINPISNDSESLELFWEGIVGNDEPEKFYNFRTTSIEYLKEMFESEPFEHLVEVQKQLWKEYLKWRGSEFSSDALKQFGESHKEFIESAVETQQKIEDMADVFIGLAKDLEKIVEMIKRSEMDSSLCCDVQENAKKRPGEAKSLLEEVGKVEREKKEAFDEAHSENMEESKVLEAFIAWAVACHLKIRALDLLANADSMASEAKDLVTEASFASEFSGMAKNKDERTVAASGSNPEASSTPGSEGASKHEPAKEPGERVEKRDIVEVQAEKLDEAGTSTTATQREEEGKSEDVEVRTEESDKAGTSTAATQREEEEKSNKESASIEEVPGTPPTQEEEKSDEESASTEEVSETSKAATQGEGRGNLDEPGTSPIQKEGGGKSDEPGTSKGTVPEEFGKKPAPVETKKGGFGRRLGKFARSTMKKLGLGKKK